MIALWLACAAPEPAPTDTDVVADTDTDPDPDADTDDYIYEDDGVVPLLDAAGVEDAATEAFAWFFAADAAVLLDAWAVAAAAAEDGCPVYTTTVEKRGYFTWKDTCTTSAGTTYDGELTGREYEPFSDASWQYWDYGWLSGDAQVDFADGQSFRLDGYLNTYKMRTHDGRSVGFYAQWIGDAAWSGGELGASWLGAAPSFDYTAYGSNDGGIVTLALDGSGSGLPGTLGAIVFERVYHYTPSCALEPGGLVHVADASGEWYQLVFHGPTEDPADAVAGDCDGCAEVWFRGRELGAACPDLTPITTYAAEAWP